MCYVSISSAFTLIFVHYAFFVFLFLFYFFFFFIFFFFFQAEDGIRDHCVTGVQTCDLPIFPLHTAEVQGSIPCASTIQSPVTFPQVLSSSEFALTIGFARWSAILHHRTKHEMNATIDRKSVV